MSFIFNFQKNRARKKGWKKFFYMGKLHDVYTREELLELESKRLKECQDEADGLVVARMIREFQSDFSTIYPEHIHIGLGAVGPLQTFLGLAIKNGHITIKDEDD